MKVTTVIDRDIDERVEIYARNRTPLVEQIEELVSGYGVSITGYSQGEITPLSPDAIIRVYVENNKMYASTEGGTYQLKLRLYQLEETLGASFIKINQSSLVNKAHIKKFSSSWGGSMTVEMSNGESDYISRRQTKTVLERMGIK